MTQRATITRAQALGQVHDVIMPHKYTHQEVLVAAQERLADLEETLAVFKDCAKRGALREFTDYLAKEIASVTLRLEQLRSTEVQLPCRDQYR